MSASESQAKTSRSSLLVVVKGEHKYLLKYNTERKMEVFDHLLACGMDDDYNLTTFDALALIEKLRAKKEDASIVSLGDDQPPVESDRGVDIPNTENTEPPNSRGI